MVVESWKIGRVDEHVHASRNEMHVGVEQLWFFPFKTKVTASLVLVQKAERALPASYVLWYSIPE